MKIIDKTRADFVGFPIVLLPSGLVDTIATNQLVASNWSRAADVFFSFAVVPQVLPTARVGARSAFVAAMAVALTIPNAAIVALQKGFDAYAAVLALSQIAPNTALPPPPGTLSIPLQPPPFSPDPAVAAVLMATAVNLWAKTGTMTTPSGVILPWS